MAKVGVGMMLGAGAAAGGLTAAGIQAMRLARPVVAMGAGR